MDQLKKEAMIISVYIASQFELILFRASCKGIIEPCPHTLNIQVPSFHFSFLLHYRQLFRTLRTFRPVFWGIMASGQNQGPEARDQSSNQHSHSWYADNCRGACAYFWFYPRIDERRGRLRHILRSWLVIATSADTEPSKSRSWQWRPTLQPRNRPT